MSNFSNQIRASSALIKRLKHHHHHRSSNPLLLMQSRSYTTNECHRPAIVQKRSLDILHDPWFNKVEQFFLSFNSLFFFFFVSLIEIDLIVKKKKKNRERRFQWRNGIVLIFGDFCLQMSWLQSSKLSATVSTHIFFFGELLLK